MHLLRQVQGRYMQVCSILLNELPDFGHTQFLLSLENYPLVVTHGQLENHPFIDEFPIKTYRTHVRKTASLPVPRPEDEPSLELSEGRLPVHPVTILGCS